MRLIDADEYKDKLNKERERVDSWHKKAISGEMSRRLHAVRDALDEAIRMLDKTQSTDAAGVKHGHWSLIFGDIEEDGFNYKTVCSVCNMEAPFYVKTLTGRQERTAYCPNCGAKMREEQNDEKAYT